MTLPRLIAAALLGALLGCTPELAEVVTPGPGWPDLAQAPVGVRDGRADAALIIAIDDPSLGGRPGAFEVGSGWWRYLVQTRGLRRSRVTLLRNEAATVRAIELAVGQLEERAGTGSVLWLVFIGSAVSSSAAGEGVLLAGDHERVAFAPIRSALAAGFHQSAFLLIDACAESPTPGFVAGLPAPVSAEGASLLPAASQRPVSTRTYYTGLARAASDLRSRVEDAVRHVASTPRNSFVLTAGVGPRCGATLDGQPWPALAYAALGGLQGWADLDEDGHVSATELSTYAQSVLADLDHTQTIAAADPDRPQLSAGGVDIILADVSHRWAGPGRRGTQARLAPEALSQTEHALEQAKSVLALDVEDMVAVPAGAFTMGCSREHHDTCEADERPARSITLDAYAIDRHEVTWAEYRACIDAGDCQPLLLSECWVWTSAGFVRGAEAPAELFADDYPVMCVNWLEAARYCEAAGKRLPTEAEWERAARGTDGRNYPWGEAPPSCKHAVMHGCSDYTQAVGSHPKGASPVGALDMSGNAAEWVHDWWGERAYLGVDHRNPTGPQEGLVRGVRGGSFYDTDFNLRSGYRYGVEPLARLSLLGFRCVR